MVNHVDGNSSRIGVISRPGRTLIYVTGAIFRLHPNCNHININTNTKPNPDPDPDPINNNLNLNPNHNHTPRTENSLEQIQLTVLGTSCLPLSPSSIIWYYCPMGSDAQRLGS